MIERICHINNEIDDSVFLLGARQTGKSTFFTSDIPGLYLHRGNRDKIRGRSSSSAYERFAIICF